MPPSAGSPASPLDGAFEPGDVPDERLGRERALEATFRDHGEHRLGRVRERPELVAAPPEPAILRGDERARDGVPRWVAEDEQPARVVCRGAEETLVVGIAADDAV